MKPLQPCKRCGGPKERGHRGSRYCPPCAEVMRSPAMVNADERARKRRAREVAIATGTNVRRRTAPDGQKWCAHCQRFLPLTSFSTNGAKASAYCIPCTREYNHSRRMQAVYGIDAAEYDRVLAVQDGRCAICLTRPRTRRLAVDHDHETGKIRGLLCTRCNHGLLGRAHDSEVMLGRAIAYLRRPPAQTGEPIGDDVHAQADLEFVHEQATFLADGDLAVHATRDLVALTPRSLEALAQCAGYALVVDGVRIEPDAALAIDDLDLVRRLHAAYVEQQEAS